MLLAYKLGALFLHVVTSATAQFSLEIDIDRSHDLLMANTESNNGLESGAEGQAYYYTNLLEDGPGPGPGHESGSASVGKLKRKRSVQSTDDEDLVSDGGSGDGDGDGEEGSGFPPPRPPTTATATTRATPPQNNLKRKIFRISLTIQRPWRSALEMSSSPSFKAIQEDLYTAFRKTSIGVKSLRVVRFTNINDTAYIRSLFDLGLEGMPRSLTLRLITHRLQFYILYAANVGNIRLKHAGFSVQEMSGCFDADFLKCEGQGGAGGGGPSSGVENVFYLNGTMKFSTDSTTPIQPNLTPTILWQFSQLSRAWDYIQENYHQLRLKPVLQIRFRSKIQNYIGCHASMSSSSVKNETSTSTARSAYEIECGQFDASVWGLNNTSANSNFESIIHVMLGYIIEGDGAHHGHSNNPAFEVSKWTMAEIMFYDVYLHLWGQTNGSNSASEFTSNSQSINLEGTESYPRFDTHWFRDWFFPIYKQYGGCSALKGYFHLLNSYRNSSSALNGTDSNNQLNMGEFVHFWSGAAGNDLQPLARSAFGWSREDAEELAKARIDYPGFNYTVMPSTGAPAAAFLPPRKLLSTHSTRYVKDELSLVYANEHVAFYFNQGIELFSSTSTDLFQITSKAWKYIQDQYGLCEPVEPEPNNVDSVLFVILHAAPPRSRGGAQQHEHIGSELRNRHHINILLNQSTITNIAQYHGTVDAILKSVGQVTSRTCEDNSNGNRTAARSHPHPHPHVHSHYLPAYNVTKGEIVHLLVYDIYTALGELTDAERFLTHHMMHGREASWVKKWFYPIYSHDGSDGGKNLNSTILSKLWTLLNQHWPRISRSNSSEAHVHSESLTNIGEFVHFWSGAAGYSLKMLAIDALPEWAANNGDADAQLLKARTDFPNVTYNIPQWNESFVLNGIEGPADNSNRNGKSIEHLFVVKNVYQDEQVLIFFDSNFLPHNHNNSSQDQSQDQQLWLFQFFSKSWLYLNTAYRNVLSLQNNPTKLHVIFHERLNQHEHHHKNAHDRRNNHCKFSPSVNISTEIGHRIMHNIIECSHGLATDITTGTRANSSASSWETETFENLDLIINAMAKIVGKTHVHLIETYIPESESESDPEPVPEPEFRRQLIALNEIVVYDMYQNGLGGLLEGNEQEVKGEIRWLNKIMAENEMDQVIPGGRKYWFRDWYLPIFEKHGGSSVLDRFLAHLHQLRASRRLTTRTQDSGSGGNTQNLNVGVGVVGDHRQANMNVGEFVHLWSGAAGGSLRDIAVQLFGWNEEYQKQFEKAMEDFPEAKYTCSDCNQMPGKMGGDNSRGIIIGISVSILIVIIISFGIIYVKNRMKIHMLRNRIRDLTPYEVDEFVKGCESVNPNDYNALVHMKPFNDSFELPQERLVIDQNKRLGSGAFGQVYYGIIKGLPKGESNENDVEVAVKTVAPNVEVSNFKSLLSEIKIMAFLGQHDNIVSLLGTSTSNIIKREVYVAMEFCAYRDLWQFLKDSQDKFVNLWNTKFSDASRCLYQKGQQQSSVLIFPSSGSTWKSSGSGGSKGDRPAGNTGDSKASTSTLNLLEWAHQIANGMEFLSSKNVIHGDLAARNVLLTAGGVAKISDFGLSRQLLLSPNYTKKSKTLLPWKWMAIESLKEMCFSPQSDVWSYGVTLWEIFTLSKIPYGSRSYTQAFINDLASGLRLEYPRYGNQKIYELMLECMKNEPSERISFPRIMTQLEGIKTKLSCSEEEEESQLQEDTPSDIIYTSVDELLIPKKNNE